MGGQIAMVGAQDASGGAAAKAVHGAGEAGAHEQAAVELALANSVESWLGAGYEASGVEQKIAALGDSGERALRAVFERETAQRYVRLRALSALQTFETESTALYFAALVLAARVPDRSLGELHPARSAAVLRRALEGLRGTAPLLGARLDRDALTACLLHADAHVRKVATEVLATLEGSDVDRTLDRQLATERSRMVRGSVSRALTSRSARSPAPR
jgi:hypothetical protein